VILEKRSRRKFIGLFAFIAFIATHRDLWAQGSEIRIAAAADLKFALDDLAVQYRQRTGNKLTITYGSSGNFLSQIQNGAPFDMFFSADIEYPRRLRAAGFAEPGSLYEYAVGRLVLWAPSNSNIDPAGRQWSALLDPSVRRIAIANPDHAPYGRAALEAMRRAGIYEQVASKLVYGENISQAAQFAQSGNAQAGIVALSLALSPGMNDGKRWEIPADAHAPIDQAVIILKRASNKQLAHAFLDFVQSQTGRMTLAKYGFTFPPADFKVSP
jgi:molybdate transport system substrate-binding protein